MSAEPEQVKRDPVGVRYDDAYTDEQGVTHYTLNHAGESADGPARWSSEHDCNPICGCHLADKCTWCGCCTSCAGCFCGED